jgi:phage gp45-like
MILGRVTNREISTNRGSDRPVLLLQVELTNERDVQDVELFTEAGAESSPQNDDMVLVLSLADAYRIAIGVDDGIEPEIDEGEKEIYSYEKHGGPKLARVKCNKDGEVIHNEGERLVAREGDEITITPETDPDFFVMMNGLALLLGLDPILSVTGKINEGSETVKV